MATVLALPPHPDSSGRASALAVPPERSKWCLDIQPQLKGRLTTGAGYSEKSAELLAQRDGYRDREWETRAGTIELRIPTLRRILLPRLFGAAADGREGAHHCCAGGQRARRLHPLGR